MTRLVIFLSSSDWWHGSVSVTSFMLIKQEGDSPFVGKRSQYIYISARQKDEGKQGRIAFQGLYFFPVCCISDTLAHPTKCLAAGAELRS